MKPNFIIGEYTPQKLRNSHCCVPFTATFSKRRKIGSLWSERCDREEWVQIVHHKMSKNKRSALKKSMTQKSNKINFFMCSRVFWAFPKFRAHRSDVRKFCFFRTFLYKLPRGPLGRMWHFAQFLYQLPRGPLGRLQHFSQFFVQIT